MVNIRLRKVLDIDMSGPQWLASAKGLDTVRSCTIAVATWSSAFYPQNRLESGLYLGKITSAGATQGMYGKYDDTATDGRQVCVGFLAGALNLDPEVPTTPLLGAFQWEGVVVDAAITTINNGVALDAAGKTDLASFFKFV